MRAALTAPLLFLLTLNQLVSAIPPQETPPGGNNFQLNIWRNSRYSPPPISGYPEISSPAEPSTIVNRTVDYPGFHTVCADFPDELIELLTSFEVNSIRSHDSKYRETLSVCRKEAVCIPQADLYRRALPSAVGKGGSQGMPCGPACPYLETSNM